MCFGKLFLVGEEIEQIKDFNFKEITIEDVKLEFEEKFKQRMKELEEFNKSEKEAEFLKGKVINELKEFVQKARIIIAQNSQLETPSEQKF